MFLALSGNNNPGTFFPSLAHTTLESVVVLPDFDAHLDLSHCVDGCREKVGRELWSVCDVRRGGSICQFGGSPETSHKVFHLEGAGSDPCATETKPLDHTTFGGFENFRIVRDFKKRPT